MNSYGYYSMLRQVFFVALAGSLLSGCTVYVPTMPATPVLQKGQVQVSSGIRSLASLEAGAAWAPTNHLLLSAESSWQSGISTQDSVTPHEFHRQVNLGLGYYRAPTPRSPWYLAALAGMGYASVKENMIDADFFSFIPLPGNAAYYEARYFRYYAQAYAAQAVSRSLTNGGSLRTVYVNYTQLKRDGQPTDPGAHFFFEPLFFMQFGHGFLQGQANIGLSLPVHTAANVPDRKITAPNSGLLGIILVFRPDLLKRRK